MKIKRKIKIIGLGGIGTAFYPELYRYLEFRTEKFEVVLIDGDIYEEKNKQRQFFHRLGPKAQVLHEMYSEKFPGVIFQYEFQYFNESNAIYLLEEHDIVIMGVDNHKTRKMVADCCEQFQNISLISGGNHLTTGDVMWYLKRNGNALTLELDNQYHPEIQKPTDKHPEEIGCDEIVQSQPQILAMNNLVSAVMFNMLNILLDNYDEPKVEYNMVYLDMYSNKTRTVLRT